MVRGYEVTSNQWKPFQRARWGKMEKDKTLANLSGNGHVKKMFKNVAEAKHRLIAITSSHL